MLLITDVPNLYIIFVPIFVTKLLINAHSEDRSLQVSLCIQIVSLNFRNLRKHAALSLFITALRV